LLSHGDAETCGSLIILSRLATDRVFDRTTKRAEMHEKKEKADQRARPFASRKIFRMAQELSRLKRRKSYFSENAICLQDS
jgi:hypothetical protein